ncbi:MAG: FAD-dependent oxidoreductase [Gammaproteobacteria bacterium]|nr:FAD-dependent oxidoreductase [Gammaproteobacteria bacterium]
MAVYDLNRILMPEAPAEYADDTRDLHYVPAPCQVACPVGTDAPSYLAYIWEGKFEEAYEAITATNPFSSICGRVCDAPCEPACRRTASDGPVQIRNLKRFVMDKVGHRYDPPPLPPSESQSVAVVGSGPAGLTAAHDLCKAGYRVHVYEMTDRLGGMMIWGIPAFRLPAGVIQEDIDRLLGRFPGLEVHLETALGRDVSLDELKRRHDAVLLTIGAWWGKSMGIPGDDDPRVVDGVGFLRRVNAGERPELPDTVVVVGGGDVAMDACRVARRLPGCQHVKVIYRRGPDEIPARRIELEGAIKEGIEFVYHTQQVAVVPSNVGDGEPLRLRCVRTSLGEPDADGRRRPVAVPGSEHDIACGMVIAAVGQHAASDELEGRGMMAADRIHAEFEGMRTADAKVFAAGDGAFGGSTIVMAMHHGQRAAYYIKAFLRGQRDVLPYRTPYRTRRVPVAQDLMWEKLPVQEPEFFGLGDDPVTFPEIEATYAWETARMEAARCYRCDAETGSADYSVAHREDIFSMARTHPADHAKHRAMLAKRLRLRENPVPEGRAPSLDDLVFLPANLSRLVIDPYREACRIDAELGGRLSLDMPFIATGFDAVPEQVRAGLAHGLAANGCAYLGARPLHPDVPWLQRLCADRADDESPSPAAAALVTAFESAGAVRAERLRDDQLLGLSVSRAELIPAAVDAALARGCELLVLDACGDPARPWPELEQVPVLGLLRDAVAHLRRIGREEEIDLVYFGGVRSGTDAAKLIALGAKAVVLGVTLGLAAGGGVTPAHALAFTADRSDGERAEGIGNVLRASASEASMMARCTGKTNLQNLEPEDLRAVSCASAAASGVPLAGARRQ